MKAILILLLLSLFCHATTISIVTIHHPISLHGTDVDGVIEDTGEALYADVIPRSMALSGAFPEDLITAIATPLKLPSNNPNYEVEEANLLVLCKLGLTAVLKEKSLKIQLDISQLTIPDQVDLTARQLLRLSLIAIRRTLEEFHLPQNQTLDVSFQITGTNENNTSLMDLNSEFTLEPEVDE